MATQTNNLGLTKPAGSDYVQVNDFNVNSDVLDAAIGKLSELRTQVKTSLVEAINEAMISGGTDSPYINEDNGHWMQWNNTLLKFEDTGVVAQGSMWYNGTSITGTSATASVFPTGITLAHVGDLYLNTNTSLVYWCAKEGNASVATWRYLCSIKGAQGIQGNTGPTGTTFTPAVNSQGIISWSNDGNKPNPPSVSIKGPKGDPGTGLDIRGTYATLAELQAAVQSPQQGWMYNVGTQAPYRVYMYDSSNGWLDQGQLQGPTGSTGKSAYNAAVEGGYQGNEDTFNAQMAGMPTHIADTNNPHSVTKSQLGLGDVDNTSDQDKPISSAQQAALNSKQAKITASGILKGNGTGVVSSATPGEDYVIPSAVPSPSDSAPAMDGVATPGTSKTYSRSDHKHPTDISRQAKITSSGILKGNGDGAVEAATPRVDYAAVSTIVMATLLSSGWTGTSAPFVYELAVSGVTASSNQEVLPATTVTADQLAAIQSANIVDGGQETGKIILKAFGDKPTIDLPIRIILRGDM